MLCVMQAMLSDSIAFSVALQVIGLINTCTHAYFMQCTSTLIIESGLGHQLGFYMSNCTRHSAAHTVYTYMYMYIHVVMYLSKTKQVMKLRGMLWPIAVKNAHGTQLNH